MPLAARQNPCKLVLIVVESGWSGARNAWGHWVPARQYVNVVHVHHLADKRWRCGRVLGRHHREMWGRFHRLEGLD
jgi:hypothetical protein